jgi:hypothetical protein
MEQTRLQGPKFPPRLAAEEKQARISNETPVKARSPEEDIRGADAGRELTKARVWLMNLPWRYGVKTPDTC